MYGLNHISQTWRLYEQHPKRKQQQQWLDDASNQESRSHPEKIKHPTKSSNRLRLVFAIISNIFTK
jgi:hypothetical protein